MLITAIVLIAVVGVCMALFPMDARVRSLLFVLLALLALVAVLSFLGVWPFHSGTIVVHDRY